MKDAMISVEDRRFRDHYGVDPIGIARSLVVRYEEGSWKQGASTITQQLARNVFLNNARTFGRKGREMILALARERKFTKAPTLEIGRASCRERVCETDRITGGAASLKK